MSNLSQDDPRVAEIIAREERRIETTLDLIAAECHPPRSIFEAQGSIFTIKAAEGYPHNRFHAGCQEADTLEEVAVSRAKTLFWADHANVQPHSGVAANLAVYFSALEIGDTVLAMRLSHGGHLSHGDPASMTSRCFKFEHYSVDRETEQIDYAAVREQALKLRPRMIVAGASSYSRLIDYPLLAAIADEVSAYLMVDMAHIAGLVAAGVIPSPVPHSDFVTFTTYKTMLGGRGGVILCRRDLAQKLDKAIFPGGQGTPSLNMIAAKAVAFERASRPEFGATQQRIISNAKALAAGFADRGYRLVAGGTDNHLVLLDLRARNITGKTAESLLESAGIIVNRNVIPYDPATPDVASGIRIGSTAITARGMDLPEMGRIVEYIDTVLRNPGNTTVIQDVKKAVEDLCQRYPVYGAVSS